MFKLELTPDEHRLMLHALTVVSQLTTGLTGADREATSKLKEQVRIARDDSVPEWQRKK
jgi:hypothetical protein